MVGGRRPSQPRSERVAADVRRDTGLSERELAVLLHLPSPLTNAEIASELYVSVNTLKSHLKAIYRKLGATSRADAIERARRFGLLRAETRR